MTVISGKQVLVIGGAGFIGSHLVERLCGNNEVYCLDNYLSGRTENHISGVTYFEGDAADVLNIFKNFKFDFIFHLGEYSRVEQSLEDFSFVMRNNVLPMINILELVKLSGAKLIYSASSTKFTAEEKFLSPYTFSKCTNTELIQAYDSWYGINYSLAYFYNVYGGREIGVGKFATVVAKFIEQKRLGHLSLKITKPGTQKRNFTHVTDTINALELIALNGTKQSYCIAASEKYSIIELAQMLDMKYELVPERPGNRTDAGASTESLRGLGWKQTESLQSYLKSIGGINE